MPYNCIWNRFDPTSLPERAGPRDLVECLIQGRQQSDGVNTSHLTDAELRELVGLSYQASLLPDEDRYPRFRLGAYWSPEAHAGFSLLSFTPALVLSVDLIRRLSSGFSHNNHALRVVSDHGCLRCSGVDSTEFWLGVLPAGRPEFWAARGRTSGLWLTVDAPGELYVSEAVHLRLRGGTIQDLVPITLVRHWEPWKKAGVDAIARILEQRRLSDIETRFGGRDSMVEMVADLIGRILDGMVTARHGGALVILPREGLNCVDLRWPVRNLNLAATAADYWEACMKASDSLTEQTVRDYLVRRDHLLHLVRSVTQLTEADGCVVLSPELEVVGFGGEITVDDRTAACSSIVFSDLDSARAWPDQSGHDLGGTRHRSAYRLCKTVPGALVFVVSQDGDLTLLYNTHDNVHAIRGLTARHGIT
jgi:Probable sensor domain DACNV